jgi:hypothetical protein
VSDQIRKKNTWRKRQAAGLDYHSAFYNPPFQQFDTSQVHKSSLRNETHFGVLNFKKKKTMKAPGSLNIPTASTHLKIAHKTKYI